MASHKYIIECPYPNGIMSYYIKDGEYTVAGERYKVITESESEAKRYSSHKRAESAAEKMLGTFANMSASYKIVEVVDNDD